MVDRGASKSLRQLSGRDSLVGRRKQHVLTHQRMSVVELAAVAVSGVPPAGPQLRRNMSHRHVSLGAQSAMSPAVVRCGPVPMKSEQAAASSVGETFTKSDAER